MSQQHMDAEQSSREATSAYSGGYQEIPTRDYYAEPVVGQKISREKSGTQPSSGQRLALTIVSIVMFMLLIIVTMLLAFLIPPAISKDFAPVFGFMGLGFTILLIVVNVQFNRKR